MASVSRTARIDLGRLASRQHGVVSLGQLLGTGISERTVSHWAAAGRIRRVFHGVYAVGGSAGDRGLMMAAVFACNPVSRAAGPAVDGEALVSHRSAAYLLGYLDTAPRVVDLTCTGRRGREIDGIRAHLLAFPSRDERGTVDRIPCTSPARTLVDLAGVLGDDSLRAAFERAATTRQLDIAAVEAVLGRGRRRGAKRLRAILEEWRPAAALASESHLRSPFEARLLPLLAAQEMPLPAVNAPVPVANRTLEVDLLWPDHRLVVEADSRRHHGVEVAFERDRKRDRDLLDAGYTVIRVTWRQAEREPAAIAASIRAFLSR
jgi:predicted transcriptional regulator of viral defense system